MDDTKPVNHHADSAGQPKNIPAKPVDLNAVLTKLEEASRNYTESLNKPILTIASSSIAATIAFVGATSEKLIFGGWESSFLLASWFCWLLSIIVILITYLLKVFALEKPLHWAKQFSQLDFGAADLSQIENSVLRNRGMFEPASKILKISKWLQIAAPILFSLGFLMIFGFLTLSFLFNS